MDETDRLAWGFTNNPGNHFRDPDGDDLTYTAVSSNPGLVRAVITSGGRLTYNAVVGGGTGTATITVTARDGEDSASLSFTVTVSSSRPESSRPGNQPETEPEFEPDPEAETQPEELETQPEEPETQPEEEEEQSFLDELAENFDPEGTIDAGKDVAKGEIVEKVAKKVLGKTLRKAIPVGGFVGDVKDIAEFASMVVDVERTKAQTRKIEAQRQQLEQQLQQRLENQQPGVGDQSSSGMGNLFNDFATALYVHQDALENGNFSLAQAFSGRKFAYPFSLAQGGAEEEGSGGSARRFSGFFSGGVDFSRFSDDSGDSDLDGSSTTYRFGLDVLPNPEAPLVTGVQLAFTRADVDFEDREIDTRGGLCPAAVHRLPHRCLGRHGQSHPPGQHQLRPWGNRNHHCRHCRRPFRLCGRLHHH